MIDKKPTQQKEDDNVLLKTGDNMLMPVFVNLDEIHALLIGSGTTNLQNLQFLLHHSTNASITIVDKNISLEINGFATKHDNVNIERRFFEAEDLEEKNLVFVDINDQNVVEIIQLLAKDKSILINIAGQSAFSNFFLNEQHSFAINKSNNRLFDEKILQVNELETVLVSKQSILDKIIQPEQKKWPRIVLWCLLAFLLMILGHAILSYVPFNELSNYLKSFPFKVDKTAFLLMLLTGFIAQMTDGSLGMGYGTIATTFLLAQGVSPAIVSSRVHSARVFSSGVSGFSHHRFGNINKKLFKTLVIPGVIGAIIGAALAFFGQQYSNMIRIPLSLYTFYLGYFIIRKAFKKKDAREKVKRAGWLAAVGGFMDAFAGGGWGTLVTSTLMTKRKSPRYVIGSVCLAEFFVVLASSITFFILLKSVPLLEVAGLIIGGLIAAPIAARLVGKLPMKTMFVLVGAFVIIASTNTIWKAILQLNN